MSAKTKIVVIHMKEIIYTCIFVLLGIFLISLLVFMFSPKDESTDNTPDSTASIYIPGEYTSSIMLGNQALDVKVTVDDHSITSISLVNASESVTAMYPLVEPTLKNLTTQICETQSLDNLTYDEENQYTSSMILNAIQSALEKAKIEASQ